MPKGARSAGTEGPGTPAGARQPRGIPTRGPRPRDPRPEVRWSAATGSCVGRARKGRSSPRDAGEWNSATGQICPSGGTSEPRGGSLCPTGDPPGSGDAWVRTSATGQICPSGIGSNGLWARVAQRAPRRDTWVRDSFLGQIDASGIGRSEWWARFARRPPRRDTWVRDSFLGQIEPSEVSCSRRGTTGRASVRVGTGRIPRSGGVFDWTRHASPRLAGCRRSSAEDASKFLSLQNFEAVYGWLDKLASRIPTGFC